MTGPAAAEAEDLAAPLYVAWQITNECNLACLHCIEESGPGKAFADELDRDQVFARHRPADGQRGPVPVVLGRRADAAPAVLRDGRARLRARRAAQDRDQRPLPRSRRMRAAEGARRQGGPGEPRRRLERDLRPDARARRVRSRPRRRAQPARRGRADRDQLLAGAFNIARGRRRGRSRLRARRLQLLHRPHDVHRQRRQGLAPPRGDRRRSTTRSSTRCARRPSSTAAACASTSTRPGCSRSCAIASSTRRRC